MQDLFSVYPFFYPLNMTLIFVDLVPELKSGSIFLLYAI